MALTDNLVSYWKLDESSGNASDSVGSNTLTNSSVTYSTGKINNGAVGNGNNKLTAANGILSLTQYKTASSISLWYKLTTFGDNDHFFFWNISNGSRRSYLALRCLGSLIQIYQIGTTSSFTVQGTTDSNWHHLVVTYNGTTQKAYLDGSSIFNSSVTINDDANSSNFFQIFYDSSAGVVGMVDEVGIWSKELSSTEVTQLYNSGNGSQYPFGTAYTLALAYNAFILTGYASTLTKALKMLLGYNAFSLTGIAVTLKRALQMLVSYGTYALTGFDVELSNLKKILLEVGNFAVTGYDATLRLCRCLTANVGSFILNGINVNLKSTAWGNDSKPSASIWTEDTKPSNSWTNDTKI